MAAWDKDLDTPKAAWDADLDTSTTKPSKKKKAEPDAASMIAADPAVRWAVGAAEPIQGAVQRLSEMPPIPGPLSLVQLAAMKARPVLDESFARTKQMARDAGFTGYDAMGLVGNMMSPASLAAGKLSVPANLLGRTAVGVASGGVGGALAPAESRDAAQHNALIAASVGGALPAITHVGAKGIEWIGNNVGRPVLDLMSESGPANILRRYISKTVGEKELPATINAAKQAVAPKVGPEIYDVPGYPVTTAEAMVGVPEGSPLARLQELTAMTRGGPSAKFGKIADQREIAINAAERARNIEAAPLRNTAIENANMAGDRLPNLLADIEQRYAGRDLALQAKGKLDTFAAQQTNLAHKWTPIPGLPRFPGRYAPHMENVAPAKEGATLAADITGQRTAEAGFKQFQADSLAAHGYFPLTPDSVASSLEKLMNKPGNRANTTVQKALGEIKDTLMKVTRNDGIIDANELYTIRKLEAGSVIDKFAKENATWDKKFTAGLLSDVQSAIDNSIEQSGGTGWKDYLRKYAGRTGAIEAAKERTALAYAPPQKTNLGGGLNIGEETRPHAPNLLSREVMAGNYLMRVLGKNIEPKIDELAADVFADPKKYAELMSKVPKDLRFDVDRVLRKANALSFGVGASQ